MPDEVVNESVLDEQSPVVEDSEASAGVTEVSAPVVDDVSEETGAAAAPAFDDSLLDRAESYGLTDEQILGFGSPEALEGALTAIDRRMAAVTQRMASATQQAPTNGASKPTPRRVVPPAPRKDEREEVAGLVDLSPYKEKLDEDAFAAIEAVHNAWSGQYADLNNRVGTLLDTFERQRRMAENEAFIRGLDESVKSFGDEWKPVFGDRETQQLNVKLVFDEQDPTRLKDVTGPDRDKWIARDKLAAQAKTLVQVYRLNGLPVPDAKELFRRARNMEFSQEQTKRDRTKLREAMMAKARGATKRPTQRDVGESKPPEADEADFLAEVEARLNKGKQRSARSRKT